jgi:tRNA-splicing ligase RtcB (3'-phosphate/5'-hydroxy nucleic acid ligase)
MGQPDIIFGDHDDKTILQLQDVASRAERTALMADGHLGYIMPIGGVAAFREQVSVTGVGFDIACGNAAIRTNLTRDELDDLRGIADEIQDQLSFGIGRKNTLPDAPVNHPLFDSDSWNALPANVRESLREKARTQLGTIGSGNHYVDIFFDENDQVWIGVHFGSRGFGHTVASGFLALDQGEQWGARVPEREALLNLGSDLGQRYWTLMGLAGEYAYAGREWVARKVVEMIGGEELELVHNHHNFAWREEHGGEEYIVVRKGATPAWPGQTSFIGGSMGDDSYIVRGVEEPEPEVLERQERAMFSTIHGAGRVMSRTKAAGRRRWKTGEVISPGVVSDEMMHGWLAEKNVILRGGGLDESPHAYRRLDQVLDQQGGTIDVQHRLTPLIVVMAGANEFDPYKD